MHLHPKTEYFLEVRSGNVIAICCDGKRMPTLILHASPTFQLLRREELHGLACVAETDWGHFFFPVFSFLMKMGIIRSGHAVQDMHTRICVRPLCIK